MPCLRSSWARARRARPLSDCLRADEHLGVRLVVDEADLGHAVEHPRRHLVVAPALAQLPLELGAAARGHAQLSQHDRTGDRLGVGVGDGRLGVLRRRRPVGPLPRVVRPPAARGLRARRDHAPEPTDAGARQPWRSPTPAELLTRAVCRIRAAGALGGPLRRDGAGHGSRAARPDAPPARTPATPSASARAAAARARRSCAVSCSERPMIRSRRARPRPRRAGRRAARRRASP